MDDTKLERIFLGGSKNIGRLPEETRFYVDMCISDRMHFLVGDCHGIDLAFQKYLHTKGYRHVTVYCSGEKCRFNLGGWNVKYISADNCEGYEFYRQKDRAMIEDCTCGLFVWNGISQGTGNNIKELHARKRTLFVHDIDGHDITIKNTF